MLAKIWKKLLLAICIIACIYNVMNKLVSRTSLEKQLKSVETSSITNQDIDENKNSKTHNSSKNEKISQYEDSQEEREENDDIDNEEDDEKEDDENDYVVVFDEE